MARRKQAPRTQTPGGRVAPFSGGQPSTTPQGAKPNWQHADSSGRDVIPRRTVNGAGRTNVFLNGGLDG